MMTPGQVNTRIRALDEDGFTSAEICNTLGVVPGEVRSALWQNRGKKHELRMTKQRLLAKLPRWWKGPPHKYFACVEANFGDVK